MIAFFFFLILISALGWVTLLINAMCAHQVTVNGADYQPQTASPNKKHAKAMAATVALQAFGEVTRSKASMNVTGGKSLQF